MTKQNLNKQQDYICKKCKGKVQDIIFHELVEQAGLKTGRASRIAIELTKKISGLLLEA